jgi:8-oxo-dGTP diphosphatase
MVHYLRRGALGDTVHGYRRIRVVAGILRDAEARVLLTERVSDPQFAGLWEFPGGKVDPDEAPGAALRRELREELDVEIVRFDRFLTVEHDYPDRLVHIEFFLVTEWQRELRPMFGQRLRWVRVGALVADELMPANAAALEALQDL